jgi:hypothetical protein
MNLNDKIKKHELLIEELNNGVDNLLNEGGALSLISKIVGAGIKAIPSSTKDKLKKLLIDKITEKGEEIVDLEKEVEDSGEEVSDETLAKLEELLLRLEELDGLSKKLESENNDELPYKRVVIEFKDKVDLDIQPLKSPEFQRRLIGTMYFKVVGLDREEKYILLKTSGYSKVDDALFFKLDYKKLEPYIDQKGEVNLIYSKYKNPNLNPVKGDSEEVYYKFVELR